MKYIKINKDAVYELLREYFITEQQNFFDNKDVENSHQSFYLDENMNFTCLLQNENQDKFSIDFDDIEKFASELPVTTQSIYSNSKLYKNISKKEVQNILGKF